MTIISNTSTVYVQNVEDVLCTVANSCSTNGCSFIKTNYELNNNQWGSQQVGETGYTSNIYICTNGAFGWEWNRPNPKKSPSGSTYPTYPNAMTGQNYYVTPERNTWSQLPKKILDMSSFKSVIGYKYPILPSPSPGSTLAASFNLAYDIFIRETSSSNSTLKLEVMIFLNCSSCVPGTLLGTMNDGYNNYNVYYKSIALPGQGTFDNVTFVISNATTRRGPETINIDIKRMLNYAKLKNKLNESWYLFWVAIGNEIWRGQGKSRIFRQDYEMNNNTIHLIG